MHQAADHCPGGPALFQTGRRLLGGLALLPALFHHGNQAVPLQTLAFTLPDLLQFRLGIL